jgi:phenylalanine-4-hydroxylase
VIITDEAKRAFGGGIIASYAEIEIDKTKDSI